MKNIKPLHHPMKPTIDSDASEFHPLDLVVGCLRLGTVQLLVPFGWLSTSTSICNKCSWLAQVLALAQVHTWCSWCLWSPFYTYLAYTSEWKWWISSSQHLHFFGRRVHRDRWLLWKYLHICLPPGWTGGSEAGIPPGGWITFRVSVTLRS